jgi:hypothetical protein
MQPELSIMTQERFISTIERAVIEKNMTYLDAIMYVCESSGLELEVVPRLISPRIKNILTSEAYSLNLLKRRRNEPRLPI